MLFYIDMWFPCRALLFAPAFGERPPPGGLPGTSHLGWADLNCFHWDGVLWEGKLHYLGIAARRFVSWHLNWKVVHEALFLHTWNNLLHCMLSWVQFMHSMHACILNGACMHASKQVLIHERAPLLLNSRVLTPSLISLLPPYFPFWDRIKMGK